MEDVEFIKPPHVIPTIATIKLPALVGDYMFIQLVKQNFLQFLTLMHLTTGSGSGGSGSGPNPLSSSMVMSKSDDSALAPQTHHHQPGEGLISQHRTLSSTMEIPMSSSMLRGGGGETNAAAGDKYEIKPSDYTFIYNFVASSSSQSALSSIGQGIATITLGCAVSENLIQENESDVPSTAVPVTYIPMTLSSNADSSRKLELIEKLLSGVQVLEVKKERENSSSSPTPLSKSTMSSSSSLDQPQFFDHIQLKIWCRGSINAQALVDKLTLSINQTLTEYLMETVISQTIVTPSSLQSEYLTPVERVMATGRSLSTTSMNEIKLPGQFHLPTYATNDFLLDVKDLINDINSKMHPSLWYTEQQTTNENDEKKPPLVKYSPKRSQQPSTTATGVATAATPSTTNISDSTISIPIVSVEQPNNNNNGLGSSSQSTLDEDSNRINLLNKHNYQLLVIGGKNIQEPVVENTTTTTTMELQLQHQIIQSETTTTTTTTVVSASMTDIASGLMTFTEESISSTSSIISSITGSTNAIVKGPPSSSSQQSVISDDYLYYPHIKDPQLVQPIHRTCSIIATIKANQFYIHTYNWSQSKLDLLQAGLNRIQTWKALRRTLLNNVLHQKMGLFNHVQPHFVNQTISSFFPDARSQSIVRYTYENVDLFVNYPSTPKKLPYSLVGNNPPPASAPRGMIKSSSLTATPAALGLPTPTTPMTSAAPTTNTTTSTTTPANNNTPATAATSTTTTTSTGNKSNSSTPANPTTTTTPSSNQPTAKKSLPEFDTILRDNSIQNTQLLQQPTVLPIIADPVQRYVGQIKALANQVEKAAEAKALFSQARSFFVDTDKSPSKHHLESIIKMSRLVHFRCVPFLYDEYLDGSHSSREQIGNQQTANNPPHLISPALVGIVHAPLKGNALPYLVMSERSLTSQGDWKGKTMEFFLGEYIHYMEKMLQSAKIIITINNDEADTRNEYIATAKRSLRAYLQQTFKGGSLLIKIGFRDLSVTCELFAVLQPTAQGSNLQTTTKNLSNMFAEEYGRFTHELHLNSFVYDFHIRQIYDFLHNNHIYYSPHQKDRAGESPRVNNVSSSAPASPLHHEPQVSPPAKYFVEMMQSLSRYYPKPPAHAFGHLHQSIMSLGVSIEPIYLFEYLTKSVQHYQISHLDEKGIFPALFFSIPGGTTSPDSGSPSFTWDVVVFCLNTKQQDEDGQDQKDMLKLSNNSTTVIPSLIMEDSKYQIQLQYIIIKTATDTTFPRLDHFSPLHPVNNQHLTMPSSSSNTSSTKQHQQQSWNSNPNLSPLPPKHHKESQSHAPSAHHVMNPKSVDHIERANKQMSINEEWVRTKLSKIITKASINFQRDRLWNKLLRGNPYEPALTIAEFSQFTHLVKRKSIKTMDIDLVSPNINLFQNMGHVWVGLCSYLVKTCGDRIRQLHNDADKHLFILNPNVDCLMLELVYNEREKESDAFVCRKEGANNCNLEEIDEQEFLHASQLVNTLCHYLWTELLKSNNTYI
ncbi:hypothetical protein DFA_12030 [Cavenderia fasciculata]|uniref:Uncharacterized protein n=1 Tax=Cavenderia fasciculata TaxID=261658 RepID=F4QFF9_CACFS|nr:uncharacterized protein DFA_12030 [Cavenderia fasciculata]EGG14260.1 hypothetical protein DFA_12030 [Cavenderia fasciculata]|eukprot:XP_004350969.1 hypothetical protein DFA_12030 [Cavenderia fasciculata]